MTIKKMLLRFEEVQTILECSRTHVYTLLREGKLTAHNREKKPNRRTGTRILITSVEKYLESNRIPVKEWNK